MLVKVASLNCIMIFFSNHLFTKTNPPPVQLGTGSGVLLPDLYIKESINQIHSGSHVVECSMVSFARENCIS